MSESGRWILPEISIVSVCGKASVLYQHSEPSSQWAYPGFMLVFVSQTWRQLARPLFLPYSYINYLGINFLIYPFSFRILRLWAKKMLRRCQKSYINRQQERVTADNFVSWIIPIFYNWSFSFWCPFWKYFKTKFYCNITATHLKFPNIFIYLKRDALFFPLCFWRLGSLIRCSCGKTGGGNTMVMPNHTHQNGRSAEWGGTGSCILRLRVLKCLTTIVASSRNYMNTFDNSLIL